MSGHAEPCRECGGTAEVLKGVEGFGMAEADDDWFDRDKRLRAANRAREAWAARTFGPRHDLAESWRFRWLNLGQHRVFHGPDADRKARADGRTAPF